MVYIRKGNNAISRQVYLKIGGNSGNNSKKQSKMLPMQGVNGSIESESGPSGSTSQH